MTVSNNDESNALDLKYRPRNLDQVIGHVDAVRTLKGLVETGKIPNAILFLGPTSAGKTTLAQAFAASASGLESIAQQQDFSVFNAGDQRTIDDVRKWTQQSRMRPLRLKRRWMLVDEAQGILTNAAAATALLVPVENPASTTTWLFTSMEPEKFQGTSNGRALLGRCTKIILKPHSTADLFKQAVRIIKGEGVQADFNKETVAKVAESCQGQMRELAKVLQSLIAWNAGRGGGKIAPEDVASILTTIDVANDTIDEIAAGWLIALHKRSALVSSRYVLLADDDPFAFLMRAQSILRTFILHLANKRESHSKVWVNDAVRLLLKNLVPENAPPKEVQPIVLTSLAILAAITDARQANVSYSTDALLQVSHRALLAASQSASQ